MARRLLAVGQSVGPLAGDVLHEGAAERDVEDLDAAADREQRHVVGHGATGEAELEVVAGRRDVVDGRVPRLAEALGLDVTAAGEHEAVQPLPEGRLDLGREVRA